ncbi:basement membrane-specific heparan sulfate proteoglycan core protein-like [Scomber scombrus]|uniref:basement membrane-specific heparan sulfate proteoglycan core protein-like n=1 Tax=Scomber scombrus TaxID=13677 RepID=UPI002DD89C90|nr:basement membrane-specific heparan sulfate proteoglycan core protein-like [Scomber scombrus]
MNIIKLILAVLMLIPVLLLLLWMRKKKALSSTTDLNEPVETIELDSRLDYENVSDLQVVTAAQTEDTEEKEDLQSQKTSILTDNTLLCLVQGQNGWGVTYTPTQICALKGSTVVIRCTYRYPSWINNHFTAVDETFWFTKESNGVYVDLRTDPEYAGRVQYHCYKTDYSYSCALKGHEEFPSPSVNAPKLPSVSVRPSAEIVEGSSVTLNCSSDANPAANYTWYKKNVNLDLQPLSKEPQLVFSSIQSSDSGDYYCAAENQLGKRTSEYIFIDVKYAPTLPSVSVSPSAEIVEGSSVTLTCNSDANPAASYTWYKKNQILQQGPEGIYYFTSISYKDRGFYHCKSKNNYGQINSSSHFIDVRSNYTWYKENEDSPIASGQIFTIINFRLEHSGNYYCEAQNRRGRYSSTLHLIVVKGLGKSVFIMNIIKLILAVLMLIPVLLLLLWMRKKKTLSSTTDLNEPVETIELDSRLDYENVSDLQVVTAAQTEDTEEQEDLQ